MGELVKPTARAELEGLGDAEIARFLSENPNSVRRPIIDTGEMVTLGFTPAVREKLGGGPGPANQTKTDRPRRGSRARARTRKPSRPKR
jgi:ArsC family